jgi:hypothetical protein
LEEPIAYFGVVGYASEPHAIAGVIDAVFVCGQGY